MAFQGFARQEDFSTNQINIDIASVIDKDLAEASRQSKFMAKNSQLQEKWGNMYLNAMINKHEVEKRNREENFKFFMDNRNKIQEQVKYNWEVQAEDASRSHPYIPSFMDMLHPALAQMAVDVGAKAIGKYFGDQAAANQKNKAVAHQRTMSAMAGLQMKASPEQLDLVADNYFKDHAKLSLEQQKEKLDYFNSLGDYQASAKSVAWIHATNGLTTIDRQIASNSPEIISNSYNEGARNFVSRQNGTDVSFYDLPTANKATFDTWTDDYENAFLKSISPEGGLLPPVLGSVLGTIAKVESQWRSRHDTQQYKQAVQNNHEQVTHALDRAPTAQDQHNILHKSDGVFQSVFGGGSGRAWDWYFEKYAPYQTANQLTQMYNTRSRDGFSMADQPKARRSRRMQKAIQQAHNREAQSWASQDQQRSNTARQLEAEIRDGVYPQEWVEAQLHNIQHGTDTEFGNMLAGMRTEDRNRITSALLRVSGKDPQHYKVSTEVSSVEKAFSESDKAHLTEQVTLSTLKGQEAASIPLVKEALDENQWRFETVIDSWLSGIKERDDPHNEWDETQFKNHIAAKINEKDTDYIKLQDTFKPIVTEIDPETGNQVPSKKAHFPGVEKYIQNNVPGASGMSQVMMYSRNSSVPAARRKITKDPTVIEALTPWMMDLHNAQKAGEDLRPILNRTPKVLVYLGSRSGKTGDSTQWINYFIEDHFTHMKPLSGDDLLTPEEVAEANSRWTGYNRMTQSMQRFAREGNTYIPRYQIPVSSTSNVTPGVRHAQGHITYESNPGLYERTGNWLQDIGLTVGGHPLFTAGGTNRHDDTVHSKQGYHPHGEGFDLTHWGGTEAESMKITRKVHQAFLHFKKIGVVNQVLGPGDPGHHSHVDIGGFTRELTPQEKRWFGNFTGLRPSSGVYGNFMQSNSEFR